MNRLIAKWNDLPSAVKASLVYMIVSVLHLGVGFITSPIFTRIMSEDDYGASSVFYSYFSVLGVVAMYCLNYGFFDNAMHSHPNDRDSLSFSVLRLSHIISLIVFLIFIVVKCTFPVLISLNWPLVIILFITFFLQPAYNLWISRQRYEYKYKTSGIISALMFIGSPLVAIIFISKHFFSDDVLNRIIGGYLPLYLVYITMFFHLGKKAHWIANKKYWKEALIFNTPLIPHYISLYILSSSDKIMIEYFIGQSDVAFYSIAATIASVSTLLWTAINSSLVPYTYSKCDYRDYKSVRQVTMPLIILNACACIFIMLFAPELLWFLAPSTYSGALNCIPPLITGAFFTSLYHVFANIIYYHEKTKYVMIASLTSAISNIILNILLIPRIGYIAAAYTTMFSYLLQACIDFWGMRKSAENTVYDVKILILISLGMITVSISSSFLYGIMLLRMGFIIFLLFLAIIFRNKIFLVVGTIRKK